MSLWWRMDTERRDRQGAGDRCKDGSEDCGSPGEPAVGYLKMFAKVPDNQLVLAGIGDRFTFDGIAVRKVYTFTK